MTTDTIDQQFDAVVPGDIVTVRRMDNRGNYSEAWGRAVQCLQASLGVVLLNNGGVATARNFISSRSN